MAGDVDKETPAYPEKERLPIEAALPASAAAALPDEAAASETVAGPAEAGMSQGPRRYEESGSCTMVDTSWVSEEVQGAKQERSHYNHSLDKGVRWEHHATNR